MKKFLMISLLIFAALFFVSCVDEEDIESAIAGSPCETTDTFRCDGDILLKCENYAWEKFKFCTGKRCDAVKGTCEATDENSGESDADTDNQGNNPGGNQGDNGDSGNSPAPNPGDDNGDSGSNPNPGDDNGDTGNGNDTADTGDTGYQPPDNGDTGNQQQECTGLSIDWSSLTTDDEYNGSYYYTSGNPHVEIEFIYSDNSTVKKGTFNLGSGVNTNYKTCTECVMIIRNNDEFFQTSGTLKIDSVDSSNNIKGTLSAKFAKATIDEDTYESTFVPGGECFEIQSGSFDNTTGGGSDTPETGCTGLSIDWNTFIYYEDENIEGYFADVEFGGSGSDDFQIQFFQNGGTVHNGTYNLGTGDNANYKTCTECVLAYQDYNQSTDEYAKLFFQKSGTLKITNATSDGSFSGTLTSVKLIEVTIDPSNDYTSTPVSGGACLEIESGSFNYSGN